MTPPRKTTRPGRPTDVPRPDSADPFGTAALRDGIVAAWRSSPTRLREDAATEADYVRAGYRDRVLTELAQNAADAATRAGIAGEMHIWCDGDTLHVANVGEPLDEAGVHALTALRASSKKQGVGQFGVGFTAVLSVADEIEVRSRTGSIRFSESRTRDLLGEHGLPVPTAGIPALRLAWPIADAPRAGTDTEVVLHLRPGIDARELLERFRDEAVDVLLELPALRTVVVDGHDTTRSETRLSSGLYDVSIGELRWWEYRGTSARWLVPVVRDRVRPVSRDVLRAPTRSDEELSLPALVVADVAMQPDRRRMLPGAHLETAAEGYASFVAALPADQRLDLVPTPGFARSDADDRLRTAILDELRSAPWLPAADGGADLLPSRAVAFPGLTDELADVLADIVPGLIVPALCAPRYAPALAAVDVHRIGPARLTELLSGHDREPRWWNRLYEALMPLVVDGVVAEELASLPVPLSDGRTVTGPRTTVLASDLPEIRDLALPWVRLVHPEAAHPLLVRLGADTVSAADLLSDPALVAAVEDVDIDDPTDDTAARLADVVLRLVTHVPAGTVPRELGALPLPDTHGELTPADELLLPDAPLAGVLVEDAPFGIVEPDLVAEYGADALRAIGVGWGFTVLRAELPTGPDHNLPDEDLWWETVDADPDTLVAVRDLDLVDEDRWAQALALLASDPATAEALADRAGYTAWWLRNEATLEGQRLGHYRWADDTTFEGLLDPCTHPDAGAFRSCLAADALEDVDLAQTLLDRLADPERRPTPAVIVAAHTTLAQAFAAGTIEADAVTLPDGVRTVSGAVVDAADALIPDRPWWVGVIPTDRLVTGAAGTATALADLLDLPVASAVLSAATARPGRATTWDREAAAVAATVVTGAPLPKGALVLHDRLTLRCSGALTGEHDVSWWVDGSGATHSTVQGLASAAAAVSTAHAAAAVSTAHAAAAGGGTRS